MKKIFLLLLVATTCFAQETIQGDPTEPCGPPRPDYWIGRKTNSPTSPFVPPPSFQNVGSFSGQALEGREREGLTKAALNPKAAQTDSYAFYSNVCVNDDAPGSNFASTYSSGGHAMAARGDTVYLVWRDDRSGTSTIYFDKSTDGGNTWGADVKVNDGDSAAVMPALALGKDGTIYVSWTDFRHITRQIYFAKSTDGGNAFTPGVHVQPATPDKQEYSSIAVNDSKQVFIAYRDYRNLSTTYIDIYCSRSIDGGSSFESSVRVDDCADSVNQTEPCITTKDSSIYISWTDFRTLPTNGSKIYFSRSLDNAQTFQANVMVNDTVGAGMTADGSSSVLVDADNNICVVWGYGDIKFTKSIDIGLTFMKPNIQLVDMDGLSYSQLDPSLACDDSGGVYCAWEDRRNGSAYPWLIYFNYSKNYGDSYATNNIHVDDCSLSQQVQLYTPTLCANSAGKVFCAWSDNRINAGGLSMDIYATAGNYNGVEGEPPNNIVLEVLSLKLYPNPFRQLINIKFTVSINSLVQLKVYNTAGQLVKTLVNADKQAGDYTAKWNGLNENNKVVSNGVYFVCLTTGNIVKTMKINYLK